MSSQPNHRQSYRTTASDAIWSGLLSRTLAPATAIVTAMLLAALAAIGSVDAATRAKPNQIRYKYFAPTDLAPGDLRSDQARPSPRAPAAIAEPSPPAPPAHTQSRELRGVPHAWYEDEVVTLCYEPLPEILKNATTRDLFAGVSKADTILVTASARQFNTSLACRVPRLCRRNQRTPL
jgi:hypothetical protein